MFKSLEIALDVRPDPIWFIFIATFIVFLAHKSDVKRLHIIKSTPFKHLHIYHDIIFIVINIIKIFPK